MAEPTHDEHLTQIRDRSRRLAAIPLETSADNRVMRDMIDSIGDVRWLLEQLGVATARTATVAEARTATVAEAMSEERLERLAGLAELPCSCANADCGNYASALTAQEAQELAAEAKRLRAHLVAEHLAAEAAETENDRLRTQLAEIGETREEWAVRFCDDEGSGETRIRPSEYYARKTLDWARAFDPQAKLLRRQRGNWREVPE